MDLRSAMRDASVIRLQLARTETFRGYRAGSTAFSALLAAAGAALQWATVSDPIEHFVPYLLIWCGVAAFAVVMAGADILAHCRRAAVPLSRENTCHALALLAPAVLVGALITLVIATKMPDAVTLLPGLWQLLYGLGLLASLRVLPREFAAMAAFYLVSGACVLCLAEDGAALSPWAMGAPFTAGQLLGAWLLRRMERRDG